MTALVNSARLADSGGRVPRSARADGGRVQVDCPCGMVLLLSPMHDAKISGAVMYSRTGSASATIANAWALPGGPLEHGGACADTTPACASCYAVAIEVARPAYAAMVARNLHAVRHLLECVGWRATGDMLAEMVRVSADRQISAGIAPTWRWHADGDLFSGAYASAVRRACQLTPNVEHWIYTRSPQWVGRLVDAPNLRVLLSADAYNLRRMVSASVRHGGLPLAMLADDIDHASELWARVATLDPDGIVPRPIVCPASGASRYGRDGYGPAHIVGVDGRRRSLARGELARGACDACRVCLPSGLYRSVTFVVHGGKRRRTIAETVVTIGARRGA